MPLPQAQVVENSNSASVHVTEEVLAKAKADADKKVEAEKQRISSKHNKLLDQIAANHKDQITAIRNSVDSAVSKHKITMETLSSNFILQRQREHDAVMARLDQDERNERAAQLQRIHALKIQEAFDFKQWTNKHPNLVQYLHLRDSAAKEHELQVQEVTRDCQARFDSVKDEFASKANSIRSAQWKQTNTVCACVLLGGAIGWLCGGGVVAKL